ncbi:hypothetical protein CTA2_1848 [Colletotrichum tanaceti]|uniref:Aminoglycoside phosphotransferase domain-containing protein n=1 Tax=Colletotrichum tanaceti TaxID=1306861 RepID=A0A4V6DGF3_9PEZI|nr:hypothetical protein CTA2_1849 [Colletotrichum tanaceti]KAJ0167559.1 hypothetical protein CTA2_1848 [Colletotrichum tanaceti]TKW52556.1 hypothetical protein CTA1_13409 [Colletotrichum tanaceti]
MRTLPSEGWTSYDDWDYNGMKERIQATIDNINKAVLIRHAERIKGQKVVMSQPFSAGQYWICFELVSEDGSLVIARVRLPRHPDAPVARSEEDEAYAIACEITTMEFVKQRLPHIPVPHVYAYEAPGSQLAADAGAVYMLLEGLYGNTLQDVEPDICNLPATTQEHIMAQWTKVQAELATISCPQIGSICSISKTGNPVLGRLASSFGELEDPGPFSNAIDYFTAAANAAAGGPDSSAKLGAFVFRDIVRKTPLFRDGNGSYPFSHMDLGGQNILVDNRFNFVGIIDWEFAQTAPWEVNHYPMPFPLAETDVEGILKDPSHIAYRNVLKQDFSRRIYLQKFQEAEERLKAEGRFLGGSFVDTLTGTASKIYACFTTLGRHPQNDVNVIREMARLAFNLSNDEVEEYIRGIKQSTS